jgi:hypothetical protein
VVLIRKHLQSLSAAVIKLFLNLKAYFTIVGASRALEEREKYQIKARPYMV